MSTGSWTALLILILLIILLIAGFAYYAVVYQPAWFVDIFGPADPVITGNEFVLQNKTYQSYITVNNSGAVTMTPNVSEATVFNFINNQFVGSGDDFVLGTNINSCQLSGGHYPQVLAVASGGYNSSWVNNGTLIRAMACQNSFLWTNGSKVEIRPKLSSGSYSWSLIS